MFVVHNIMFDPVDQYLTPDPRERIAQNQEFQPRIQFSTMRKDCMWHVPIWGCLIIEVTIAKHAFIQYLDLAVVTFRFFSAREISLLGSLFRCPLPSSSWLILLIQSSLQERETIIKSEFFERSWNYHNEIETTPLHCLLAPVVILFLPFPPHGHPFVDVNPSCHSCLPWASLRGLESGHPETLHPFLQEDRT